MVNPQGVTNYIPLELNRKYTVGSIDYIWENDYRDGYMVFSEGSDRSSPEIIQQGVDFRSAVEEVISKLPDRMVTTQIEDRIVKLKE